MRHLQRGAATVDFALTCSLGFVPMLFGVLEYSWFEFQQIQVQAVCQSVVREAVAVPNDSNPDTTAEELLVEALEAAAVRGDVDVTAEIIGEPPARLLELDVRVRYEPLIGLVPTPEFIGSTWSGRMEDQSEE
jgi:hypothetical protein